jgi:hypothetical protein
LLGSSRQCPEKWCSTLVFPVKNAIAVFGVKIGILRDLGGFYGIFENFSRFFLIFLK